MEDESLSLGPFRASSLLPVIPHLLHTPLLQEALFDSLCSPGQCECFWYFVSQSHERLEIDEALDPRFTGGETEALKGAVTTNSGVGKNENLVLLMFRPVLLSLHSISKAFPKHLSVLCAVANTQAQNTQDRLQGVASQVKRGTHIENAALIDGPLPCLS